MATIFVTGAYGFVGSKLTEALREAGDEVVAFRRGELDLTDVVAVEQVIRDRPIDAVVHLAACLDRRELPEAQELQWRDTFAAGRSVVDASARAGVELLIAAGSMDEVGLMEGLVSSDARANPMTTYGLCKSLLVQHASFVTSRHHLQVEWFRPTTIYGPGQGPGPMLIPAAFGAGIKGTPAGFTSGEQSRDFIYVDDLVDWIVSATKLRERKSGVTISHVGSSNPTPVREVLQRIEKLTGGTFELGAVPRREGEPDLFGVPMFSDTRVPLSEWQPNVDLDEGLRLTADWWAESTL